MKDDTARSSYDNTSALDLWQIPQAIWRAIAHLGYSVDAVFAEADLSEVDKSRQAPLITDQALALWAGLERVSADSRIGFKLLRAAREVGGDTAFLAALHAPTYRDALQNIVTYKRLHSPERLIHWERDGLFHAQRVFPYATIDVPRAAVDFHFGMLLGLGRIATGYPIAAMHMALARPRSEAAFHADYYGCAIRYDAPLDHMVLRSVDLDRPLITHDVEIHDASVTSIRSALAARDAETDIVAQAGAVVALRLREALPTLAHVAQTLGMSERSLQRQLEARGASVSTLILATRRKLAVELLSRKGTNLKHLAERLGYADVASFSRAFRSWYGVPPGLWRRQRQDDGGRSGGDIAVDSGRRD